jgi:mannose-1-phosphate guanylyltransferase
MPKRIERLKALLLAGGMGTRLRPLTDVVPKCLIPINGRPLLDYWVQSLVEAGIREARINTHSLVHVVRNYIKQVNTLGQLHLIESYEPVLLGSAGTLTANADLTNGADDVVIIYADNLSNIDLRPLIAFHRWHGDPLTMVLFRAPEPCACGIVELDRQGRVLSFVEKPEQPVSDLANAGLYVMTGVTYHQIVAMRAFDLGFDVLPRFVGRMRGWVWGGYHRDIGTHEALERARRDSAQFFPGTSEIQHHGQRPAVFLDRDGTLIKHVPYLSDPALVQLLPGAAGALKRLRCAGFACVLVTNQSAIGRGLITEDRLSEIHSELNRQLACSGATIDSIHYCPDLPSCDNQTPVVDADRKPGSGMLLRAAAELGIDLSVSWMVGDLMSDVLAGINAGCRSILVESGQTSSEEAAAIVAGRALTAPDLAAAAALILDDQQEHA